MFEISRLNQWVFYDTEVNCSRKKLVNNFNFYPFQDIIHVLPLSINYVGKCLDYTQRDLISSVSPKLVMFLTFTKSVL